MEVMVASDVAKETADRLKGINEGSTLTVATGEGTGDGDGDGDKESVRLPDEEAVEMALFRFIISDSMAKRP